MKIDVGDLVECFADRGDMMPTAAEHVVTRASEAITARGRFHLALSGGATPQPLYRLLATPPYATRVEWSRVHVFWGDERCVPPDHFASNYRMAREALLDHVSLPPSNVHRIRGEVAPIDAALIYEDVLRDWLGGHPGYTFDLVLLGMGADGHTASLFPGARASRETDRWVVATQGPQSDWRVTLTPVVLEAAAEVTFLVVGADKAERLKEVLDGHAGDPLPAQLIRPRRGRLQWMVDAAAASRIRATRP